MSLPSTTPIAPSVFFRTDPGDYAFRDHGVPIEATVVPSHPPAHASLPQRPHARIRLPSGRVPTRHLIFDPTLALFVAAPPLDTCLPRSFTAARSTTGGFFKVSSLSLFAPWQMSR